MEIHIGILFSLEDKIKLIRFRFNPRAWNIITHNKENSTFPIYSWNNFFRLLVLNLRNKSSVIKFLLRLFPRRRDHFLSAYFYDILFTLLLRSFVSNDESSLKNEASFVTKLPLDAFSVYFQSQNFVILFFFYDQFAWILSNALDAHET